MPPKKHTKFANGATEPAPREDVPGPLSIERLKGFQDRLADLSEGDLHFTSSTGVNSDSSADDDYDSNDYISASEGSSDVDTSDEPSFERSSSQGSLASIGDDRRDDGRDDRNRPNGNGTGKVVVYDDSEDEDVAPPSGPHLKTKRREIQLKLAKEREDLPVYQARAKILAQLLANKVTVLLAETGSGKSTQIPQILLENDPTECIAVTQPRRVAAISLASRVSEEVGVPLGDRVGYTVRFQNKTSQNTRIKYLTDGMLLRELMLDSTLSRYTTIILDEAHERTVLTDLLMGLLKRLAKTRSKPLRLVIMSATLDAEKFSAFFDNAEILFIEGKMYPVQRFYLQKPIDDVVDGVVQAVCQINASEPTGDVLVFLPGQDEIDKSTERLNTIAPDLPKEAPLIVAIPLYAALSPAMQQKAFEKLPSRRRKVILATNIAETSLTIPGVRYVVDSGLRKVRVWRPSLGLDTLFTTSISRASAAQRMGRAGREAAGKCFRLFTEATYSKDLVAQTEPEILRTDIASTVLLLKKAGVDDILNFEWVETPGTKAIASALVKLYGLKALDDEGKITPLGQQMVLLPVSPHLAAVLIHAKTAGVELLSVVLDVVACLSVEDLLVNPSPDKRDEINERRRELFGGGREHGDLMMLKEMYDMYRDLNGKREQREWCQSVGVSARAARNVGLVREQLERYMGVKTEVVTKYAAEDVVRCFLHGYVANTALGLPDRRYRTVINNQYLTIHPSSMMFGRKVEAIMYMEYVYTTKGYARMVSPVQTDWIKETAPHLLGRREA